MKPKSSRRRAREFALQGLYQWQVAGHDWPAIEAHTADEGEFSKCDRQMFRALLRGCIDQAGQVNADLAQHLDRPIEELSPIERSILMIAAFEFRQHPETPYRVVINEAIELAKEFGGTDGHKYVNGVLDKLAADLRAVEVGAARSPR